MSDDPRDEDNDPLDLPEPELDAVSTGAAADSADSLERYKEVPRVLRYALLVCDGTGHINERLIAEIDELCPKLPQNTAWAVSEDIDAALELAAELDHRAVTQNEPTLRSLADCVRLLSLPTPRNMRLLDAHRRVAKALVLALRQAIRRVGPDLCGDMESVVFGWAALANCTDLVPKGGRAIKSAATLGKSMAEHRIAAAKAKLIRRQQEDAERRKKEAEEKAVETTEGASEPVVPDHHRVVVQMSKEAMSNSRIKDIVAPLLAIINAALPLVEMPPLKQVRDTLLFEFPYAPDVIDFALSDIVGRSTVRLRPLLLVGPAGGGKSLFARRLGEILGISVWRSDAAQSDSSAFAGTDRRWHSAEPCHPLLAVRQGKIANPMVLIDELDKAPTRSDHGRLWDCLLAFLEPETAARYPDPALQSNLDLSELSFVATANSLDPLPSPLRDRFRVVAFPRPTAEHLDLILPAVLVDLARERGLDRNWLPALNGLERAAVARNWHGGSVRRLKRTVEAIIRYRELGAVRN